MRRIVSFPFDKTSFHKLLLVPYPIRNAIHISFLIIQMQREAPQSAMIAEAVHAKPLTTQKRSNAYSARRWDVLIATRGTKQKTTDQFARCASLKLRHAHAQKSSRTPNATLVGNSFAQKELATYAKREIFCLKRFTAFPARIAIAMIGIKQNTSFHVLNAINQLVPSAIQMYTNGITNGIRN